MRRLADHTRRTPDRGGHHLAAYYNQAEIFAVETGLDQHAVAHLACLFQRASHILHRRKPDGNAAPLLALGRLHDKLLMLRQKIFELSVVTCHDLLGHFEARLLDHAPGHRFVVTYGDGHARCKLRKALPAVDGAAAMG